MCFFILHFVRFSFHILVSLHNTVICSERETAYCLQKRVKKITKLHAVYFLLFTPYKFLLFFYFVAKRENPQQTPKIGTDPETILHH